jgi:hypothetical protein
MFIWQYMCIESRYQQGNNHTYIFKDQSIQWPKNNIPKTPWSDFDAFLTNFDACCLTFNCHKISIIISLTICHIWENKDDGRGSDGAPARARSGGQSIRDERRWVLGPWGVRVVRWDGGWWGWFSGGVRVSGDTMTDGLRKFHCTWVGWAERAKMKLGYSD